MKQIKHLGDVEIVGNSHALEGALLGEQLSAEWVGNIERKISDLAQITMFVVLNGGEVANKHGLGAAAFDELEVTIFAGFENAWRGEHDIGMQGDGFFVASRVLKVAVDGGEVLCECGFELLHVAAEHGEGGFFG